MLKLREAAEADDKATAADDFVTATDMLNSISTGTYLTNTNCICYAVLADLLLAGLNSNFDIWTFVDW